MFKGQFKFNNANGISSTYSIGDIVTYQGKLYRATKLNQKSPIQDPTSWKYLNNTEPFKGSLPPVNPKENQIWVADSGISYIYFYDGDSYQWIAV
jgi:hypothetical protein